MFKIGDKAVYPAHGVGIIEEIQYKVIGGSKRMFYVLRILEKDMTIMIPKDNVQNVGLRESFKKKMFPRSSGFYRKRTEKWIVRPGTAGIANTWRRLNPARSLK